MASDCQDFASAYLVQWLTRRTASLGPITFWLAFGAFRRILQQITRLKTLLDTQFLGEPSPLGVSCGKLDDWATQDTLPHLDHFDTAFHLTFFIHCATSSLPCFLYLSLHLCFIFICFSPYKSTRNFRGTILGTSSSIVKFKFIYYT
jgi:hypothetical protein